MNGRNLLSVLASAPLRMSRSAFAAAAPGDIPGIPSSVSYSSARAYWRQPIAEEQFAGAVLMINRGGQPDFVDVTGWLDGNQKTLIPRDGIFFLGSFSKPVNKQQQPQCLQQLRPINIWHKRSGRRGWNELMQTEITRALFRSIWFSQVNLGQSGQSITRRKK